MALFEPVIEIVHKHFGIHGIRGELPIGQGTPRFCGELRTNLLQIGMQRSGFQSPVMTAGDYSLTAAADATPEELPGLRKEPVMSCSYSLSMMTAQSRPRSLAA